MGDACFAPARHNQQERDIRTPGNTPLQVVARTVPHPRSHFLAYYLEKRPDWRKITCAQA